MVKKINLEEFKNINEEFILLDYMLIGADLVRC